MKSKEMIGKEVLDAGAKVIGRIKDLDIDLKKWTVSGIVVKTGYIRKTTILTGDIDKIGDKVVLKVSIDKIQKA
jgi:sporulation protein YlmC with PRC-barrel domain